jgi:hypothetical protein
VGGEQWPGPTKIGSGGGGGRGRGGSFRSVLGVGRIEPGSGGANSKRLSGWCVEWGNFPCSSTSCALGSGLQTDPEPGLGAAKDKRPRETPSLATSGSHSHSHSHSPHSLHLHIHAHAGTPGPGGRPHGFCPIFTLALSLSLADQRSTAQSQTLCRNKAQSTMQTQSA